MTNRTNSVVAIKSTQKKPEGCLVSDNSYNLLHITRYARAGKQSNPHVQNSLALHGNVTICVRFETGVQQTAIHDADASHRLAASQCLTLPSSAVNMSSYGKPQSSELRFPQVLLARRHAPNS